MGPTKDCDGRFSVLPRVIGEESNRMVHNRTLREVGFDRFAAVLDSNPVAD